MDASERTASAAADPARLGRKPDRDTGLRAASWTGGGTNGNEQLTATVGTILIALLAVLSVTILRIGQLLWLHLFLGLLLLGPVALKMASTGYRFTRYYAGDREYRRKGPPLLGLRLIAPLVVISTLVVFISGIVLLIEGPSHRGQLLLIHKVSFFVWLAFMALHVLGHLPGLGRALRAVPATEQSYSGAPGNAGRWLAIGGALVAGLVLALVLIPQFSVWTAHGAFPHHHHG